MAKKYNGGIVLSTGFKIDNPSPVADYLVVELISDLTNPVTLPNQFTGMTTFVLEDQNAYVLKNTGWEKSGIVFTGGTVSGATIFTNGLTANTISATTYQNLPKDIFVTGGTYTNGTVTFTNNTGGTFNVVGLTTPFTGGTVTGATNFTNGLTANTISATTYYNLPTGQYLPLSGGTVSGTTIFTGGLTANTISATTYQNLPATPFLPLSGGTVSGATNFTSGLTANTISATTYQNLPSTPFLPLSGGSINGQVFITPTTTDYPLEIYSRNFVGGSSGTRTFFYTPSGVTYSSLNVRAGGGPSSGNLLLQSDGNGKVGINTNTVNPTLNFNLDVNGSFGAQSVSATTYYNLPTTLTSYLPLSGGTVTGTVVLSGDTYPLRIVTSNYSPGVSGSLFYFIPITGTTNGMSLNARSNGGGSDGDLLFQVGGGKVGIGTNTVNPTLNYLLDVNGSLGAKSVSATTITANTLNLKSTNSPSSSTTTYTPFIDDYNRATLSPGGTPSLVYTNTNTGNGNTTISASTYLNILNGLTAGQSYTTIPLSGFTSPFNPTLGSNSTTTTIEWSFNLRTNRVAIFAGFGASSYGGAVVLASTTTNLQNAGNGYALVYGTTASRTWKLVRYTGGLSGTQTDIVSGGNFSANTSYVSARIVYAPATNTWTYYFRDDGITSWGDPTTVNTLVGSAVDSTYTSSLMSVFGVFFNYSTATNQNLQFDNLRVQQVNNPPLLPINMLTVNNYLNTPVFNVKDDGTTSISGTVTTSAAFVGVFSGTSYGNGSALTLGQFGTMVSGTTALSVTTATTSLTTIPGLSTTITVPSQTMVYIQTNGGINTTSTIITGGSAIDVAILVDGVVLATGGYQRIYADNPTGNATVANWVVNWNTSVILTLSAGTHTVEVDAVYIAGATATVSGGSGAVKQGTLTIMILKNT